MAVPPDEVILAYKFLSVHCHTLNNPMEHGRATDDTTFGIKSLADVNVALHEDLERNSRATRKHDIGYNTPYG